MSGQFRHLVVPSPEPRRDRRSGKRTRHHEIPPVLQVSHPCLATQATISHEKPWQFSIQRHLSMYIQRVVATCYTRLGQTAIIPDIPELFLIFLINDVCESNGMSACMPSLSPAPPSAAQKTSSSISYPLDVFSFAPTARAL